MADRIIRPGEPGANPDREALPTKCVVEDAEPAPAGASSVGRSDANMMTTIRAENLDGDSAVRSDGPEARDLTALDPIDEVIDQLKRCQANHAVAFFQACAESGIDLSVTVSADGAEQLFFGSTEDAQEPLRRVRIGRLAQHLRSVPERRQDVIDLVNWFGCFADNRPFGSIEEAATEFLSIGGRIYVLDSKSCADDVLTYVEKVVVAEPRSGYPMRRILQRYYATMRAAGAREELAEIVKRRGTRERSAVVWELPWNPQDLGTGCASLSRNAGRSGRSGHASRRPASGA